MSARKKEKEAPYEWLEYDTELLGSCSFYTQYFNNPPWPFRWHYHTDHYEILLHLENPGQFLIGDTAGTLTEGDMFVLGPGLAHSFYHAFANNRPTRCYTLRFPVALLDKCIADFPELAVCNSLKAAAPYGLRYCALEISHARNLLTELIAFKNRASIRGLSVFLDLLGTLAASGGSKICKTKEFNSKHDERKDRINLICNYLIKNYREQLTLDEVAEISHMSVANLCVFFRKKTGRTVIQYIHELRIAKACELLTLEEKPIIDIAQDSGYQNLSHFNRQFLRQKEMTPREYRKICLNTASASDDN